MSQHPYQPQYVYVQERPRRQRPGVSALGLAGLVLGFLALFAGLVPFCGAVAAIPMAILGLVLAIVGFIGASAGGTKGVGVPFFAAIICIGAIVFPIFVTGGFVGLWNKAQRELDETRQRMTTQPATGPTTAPTARRAR